jgi:signal transduction histidine kinase
MDIFNKLNKEVANKTTDPVCGMTVDPETGFSFRYEEREYSFCSERCRKLFEQEPELFISMQDKREKVIEAKRTESLKKLADQFTHEIRNPLTSIGGFARRILKSLPEDATNFEYMKRVIEDIERLEKMVNRLVRFESEQLRLEISDINRIIVDALEAFDFILKNNNVILKLSLQVLPEISVDRGKIKSALSNILKNAVEAMMDEGQKLLSISSRVENDHIVVSISDTGKGIPEEKIKYIFDPLFTSKVYGPGLGLSFVKEVVRAHGGDIAVESTVGKGTTFSMSLPLNREDKV